MILLVFSKKKIPKYDFIGTFIKNATKIAIFYDFLYRKGSAAVAEASK